MPIAISPNAIVRHVLEEDRPLPKEQQSTFLLGPLTHEQTMHAEELIQATRRVETTTNAKGEVVETVHEIPGSSTAFAHYVVKCGLRGWENFKDSEGKAIEFTTHRDGQVNDALLSHFAPHWKNELASAIRAIGRVSKVELGK